MSHLYLRYEGEKRCEDTGQYRYYPPRIGGEREGGEESDTQFPQRLCPVVAEQVTIQRGREPLVA